MGRIYSPLKVLQYSDKVQSLPQDNPSIEPPIQVRIKPTNVCNHSCWYCAYRYDELQLGQDMVIKDTIPRDKMMEILSDLSEMKVQAVTFSGGGEPFYYKHFLETIRRLSDTQIRFASLTNGSRVTGEVAELFAHHGTWLRVSIDGWDEESYSRYRHLKKPQYGLVLENMAAFKRHGGKCRLGISLIIDQQSAPHVFASVQRLKNCGADSVKLSPVIVSNDGNETNRYHQECFAQVREQIERCQAELAAPDFEIFDAYHELETRFDKAYGWCPFVQIVPVIGADLRVYTCQDKAYNLDSGVLGSIENQRFKDFWMDGKDKFFRIDPRRDCRHHCVANAKNKLVHEFLEVDPEHGRFV